MEYPFVSHNQDFLVEVNTEFDFNQSNPLQFHYFFRYDIRITNEGEKEAQLISRKWFIKDGRGEIRVVEGPGVVGNTPRFKPGDSFSYSSFCPLPTLTGEMWGHFVMKSSEGDFLLNTPKFKFQVPAEFIDVY